jgi:dihydroneopterin aldolase
MLSAGVTTGDEHQIHIEQLEVLARVGISAAERETPQRLIVNLTMWPQRDLRDLKDQIKWTVDYLAVCEAAKRFIHEQSPRLVETLADRLAMHLLRAFAIRKVCVEMRKFVLPDTAYVSVTVKRGTQTS